MTLFRMGRLLTTIGTGRESDKFMLRFPDGMREEIKRLATEDGRSMNAQIIELLKSAVENSGIDVSALLKMITEQQAEIARLRKQLKSAGVDDDGSIRVRLPKEVLGSADVEALARDQDLESFVVNAVKREVGHHHELNALADEIQLMEADLKDVAAARDAWKHLYEQMQKTGTLFASLANGAIKEILAYKDEIPEPLEKYARVTRSALNSSITDLFDEFADKGGKND